MKKIRWLVIFGFLAILGLCYVIFLKPKKDLRGDIVKSNDGNTYLVFEDVNEGACDQIMVDGKKWSALRGVKAQVPAGVRTIKCGGELKIYVPPESVFHFRYWGP